MSNGDKTGMDHPCVDEVKGAIEKIYPQVKGLIDQLKGSMEKLDQRIAEYNAELTAAGGDWYENYWLENTYQTALSKIKDEFGKAEDFDSQMREVDYLMNDWLKMQLSVQSQQMLKDLEYVYDLAGQDSDNPLPGKALVKLNQVRITSGGKPGDPDDDDAPLVAWFKENSAIWKGFWVVPGLEESQADYGHTNIADPNSPLGLASQIMDLLNEFKRIDDDCTDAIQLNDAKGRLWTRPVDKVLNMVGIVSDAEMEAKYAAAEAAGKAYDKLFPSQLFGDYAEKYSFKEQCFLLAKIVEIAEHKKLVVEKENPKGLPYDPGTSGFGNVNACLMADGDSYGFINRLTQHPNQSLFFNMKPEEISNLQPMIRLFKVERTSDGEEVQKRIYFDSYASSLDVENIFKDKRRRGFGVGIKSFEFTYDGNNPFAAKKSIRGKLTIFANNFQELLENHRGFRYIDLALKTGGTKKTNSTTTSAASVDSGGSDYLKALSDVGVSTGNTSQCEEDPDANLGKLNFRLKAVVGMALPTGGSTVATEVMSALSDSFITLNLTPTIHDFKFDQMGRVTFTINYLAYVEDFFDQPSFNIFTNVNINQTIIERKLKYKHWRESDDCGAEKVAQDKKKLAEEGTILREKRKSLSTLISTLMLTGRVFYIDMTMEDIFKFQREGPYFKHDKKLNITENAGNTSQMSAKLDAALGGAMSGDKKKGKTDNKSVQIAISKSIGDIKNQSVGYFYVSDMLDVILASIDRNLEQLPKKLSQTKSKDINVLDVAMEVGKYKAFQQQFKKFRVLMGPLEIVGPNLESKFVNFGDVPISIKYFMAWITGQLLKKDQVVYPLPKFLNDLFNNLLRDFLNNDDCFSFSTSQKARLNQAVLTTYKEGEKDEFTTLIRTLSNEYDPSGENRLSRLPINVVESAEYQPILNTSGISRSPINDTGVANEINYLVYFAGRTQPTEKMKGDRPTDEARGIFHYALGKPQGIVKTIELEKTDVKGLKEVRFEQEDYKGLEQLREVYNVKIKTYANVSTFPGTYIFVDPRGFAPGMTVMDDEITDLTRFGIGGYHMIWKSTHKFGIGVAESTIHAKWVAQIDFEEECAQRSAYAIESSDEKTKKCQTLTGHRKDASSSGGLLQTILGWVSSVAGDVMGDSVGIPPNGESESSQSP